MSATISYQRSIGAPISALPSPLSMPTERSLLLVGTTESVCLRARQRGAWKGATPLHRAAAGELLGRRGPPRWATCSPLRRVYRSASRGLPEGEPHGGPAPLRLDATVHTVAAHRTIKLLLITGDWLEVEGSIEEVERRLSDASRSTSGALAWLKDAGTEEAVGVNPEYVVTIRRGDD
jgi:hypothetical protein